MRYRRHPPTHNAPLCVQGCLTRALIADPCYLSSQDLTELDLHVLTLRLSRTLRRHAKVFVTYYCPRAVAGTAPLDREPRGWAGSDILHRARGAQGTLPAVGRLGDVRD